MKLWDDPRIIEEASVGAIELYSHAVNGEKLERDKAKRMFGILAHVLAWCYVESVEANIKKENEEKKNESEVFYDDPNM